MSMEAGFTQKKTHDIGNSQKLKAAKRLQTCPMLPKIFKPSFSTLPRKCHCRAENPQQPKTRERRKYLKSATSLIRDSLYPLTGRTPGRSKFALTLGRVSKML